MSKEFRHIVRVIDTDLGGTYRVDYALTKIKGVGSRFAKIITQKAGVDPNTRVGFLSDDEVKRIEAVLLELKKYGVSDWLMNHRKDLQTGKDTHLLSADLALQSKTDIEFMREIRSWRGIRHTYGLKVRGQHTKTTGRRGKAIGVKKVLQQQQQQQQKEG